VRDNPSVLSGGPDRQRRCSSWTRVFSGSGHPGDESMILRDFRRRLAKAE
jgi:hypothetical protein